MVLVPPSLEREIKRAGLEYRVGDEPPRTFVDHVWSRVRAGPPDDVAGLIDRELFADRCAREMLGAARQLRDSWRPDLVVREPCEYASAIAAHEAEIAQAQVGISLAALEWEVLEIVTPIIERSCPGVAHAIKAGPYLTSFPASLDPSPWQRTVRFRQPLAASGTLPNWWPHDDRPLIYVTFGSVVSHLPEAAGVYRSALDAISHLPARVLLTTGRGTDPAQLGTVPENTHVEQWVPQHDVLPHADVVVCHGGSGTSFGALAAGVPLVICPLFADQSANGRLIHDAGAGLVVPGRESASGGLRGLGPTDVAALRQAIEHVLDEPGYHRAAKRTATEMAAMPTLEETIEQVLVARRECT
jgi:UDP:flavonoid glycosyltransferase YjiC (YdhE family)